ncbi:Very-long-chain aldehyde decarbonylase GL1-9 [Linum grandiflorum]
MVFWEGYLSDEAMGIVAPILVYWFYAGFYELLPPLDRYRLHPRKEEDDQKKLVPFRSVVKGVLIQQLVQASLGSFIFYLTSKISPPTTQTHQQHPPIELQAAQFIIAMFVVDAWQYFAHRYMHQNKFLYRRVHSQHHRLVIPYAIGTLYNHPAEAVSDTIGAGLAYLVSGMGPRTAVFFFSFHVVKTVDDHCGMLLPWNILRFVFYNNGAYHDIHHQLQGSKYNYSQAFFSIWDRVFGTHMPYVVVERDEGGYEARLVRKS